MALHRVIAGRLRIDSQGLPVQELPYLNPVVYYIREAHWNRNQYNQNVDYITARDHWTKLLPKESVYHQIGPGNERNMKFVSPDGHSELVFNCNYELVTDPINRGTYNFYGPRDLYGVPNFVFDVIPYYIWGNSRADQYEYGIRIEATIRALSL